MLSKELFIKTVNFIIEQREKESNFIKALEGLSPNSYCDCFLYDMYEDTLVNVLVEALNDKTELIPYYLYDFKELSREKQKAQIAETPEVASLETIYDYLVANMDETK